MAWRLSRENQSESFSHSDHISEYIDEISVKVKVLDVSIISHESISTSYGEGQRSSELIVIVKYEDKES